MHFINPVFQSSRISTFEKLKPAQGSAHAIH